MSGDISTDLYEENSISRVGPWRNKDEFDLVYHWLFSSENDIELRRKAYEKLLVWKVRRLNLTPATILSTLSILEVQLKDASNECSVDDLRKMYSNAFTRFLNFVSSILHSRSLPTMYSTARELGIESFIVDLRHLCAHGQVLPSIEICRRTAVYCMNWIRKFYWDRELNVITDANASDVRLKSSLELENLISECFQLYEISTEAISKGFKIVSELLNDKNIQFENIHLLETFVEQNPHSKITLKFVASKMINTLAALSNHEECQRHKENIFCDNFIGCKLFMDHTASVYDEKIFDKRLKFIHVHQNLFRLFAISDFINALFNRLVIICEDDCESDERRKAASFWCNEIAHGFRLFKEFKNFYKSKKEKKANYDLDLTSINNDVMTDDVKEIYRKLGTDTRGTLIFGDTVRRPWSLHFDRNFLMDRVVNLNEFTVELVKKCVHLTEPPLNTTQNAYVIKMISIYSGETIERDETIQNNENDHIHTVEQCIEKQKNQAKAQGKCSVWSKAPEYINWKSCPIGSML